MSSPTAAGEAGTQAFANGSDFSGGGRQEEFACLLIPEGRESQEWFPRQCVGRLSIRTPRSEVCLDLCVCPLPGAILPLLPSES